MHAVLGAAEVLGGPAVVLLGDPRSTGASASSRRGARHRTAVPDWALYFQVRQLGGVPPRGLFRYVVPFDRFAETPSANIARKSRSDRTGRALGEVEAQ